MGSLNFPLIKFFFLNINKKNTIVFIKMKLEHIKIKKINIYIYIFFFQNKIYKYICIFILIFDNLLLLKYVILDI